MKRRRFLATSTAAAAFTIRPVRADNCSYPNSGSEESTSSEIFDSVQFFLVEDLVDGSWDPNELRDEISEIANIPCYVYEKASDVADSIEENIPQIPELGDLDPEILDQNPEEYDWFIERFDDVLTVVSHLSFLPDRIREAVDSLDISPARDLTKYVPFFWNLSELFSLSCRIHEKHEKDVRVEEKTFKKLFQHIGLLIFEIMLLFVSGGYSMAFSFTGKINQKLIARVGKKVGWNVYSWLLSEIHWCIRIIYSESMGIAISESTEIVASKLAEETEMSKSCAEKQAKDQVKQIAEEGYGSAYLSWKQTKENEKLMEKLDNIASDIDQAINRLFRRIQRWIDEQVSDFQSWLPEVL